MERRHHDDFEQILESCLDELNAGQGTIDSILSRYPELENELKPLLEAAQWMVGQKEVLDPRPGFVASSRWRLVEQIRTTQVERPPTLWEKVKASFALRPNSISPQFALGVMLLLLFFCGAAGTTFSSQSSIPGDVLYPVKIGWEEAALALTPGDVGDARLNVEFVQRRLEEIKALALEGRYEEIPESVTQFEDRVSEATKEINLLAQSRPVIAFSLATTLKETLSSQVEFMAELADEVPQETKPHLARMQLASQISLSAMQNVLEMEIDLPGDAPTATQTPTSNLSATRPAHTATPTMTAGGGSSPVSGTATKTPSEVAPSDTPISPSATPVHPTSTPVPPDTSEPPAATPRPPTNTPDPTDRPDPTNTPRPTSTPVPDTPTMPPPPSPVTPTSPPTLPPTATPQPTPTDPPPPATPTSPPRPSHTPKPNKTDKP